MATKNLTRAVQKAYQNPSLLLPFLSQQQQQQFVSRSAFKQETGNTLDVSSSPYGCSPFLDEISQHSWIPRSGLGFPPQTEAENRNGSLVLFNKLLPFATLSPHCDGQLHNKMQTLGLNPSLVLSQDKLQSPDATRLNPETLWKLTNSSYFPPSTEIDEVVLPSQNEDVSSPILMSTKRTFNPSTIVRKRRHGFLARKSTVGGRRILARRFSKGRRRLSA